MAFKPWMTSNDLIESIKRKISFPISQNTFSNKDILAFANEEMLISQVPSVMTFHEEYFVYAVPVALEAGVTRYAIPNRAVGMKMRDLFYQDGNGNLFEMSRISPGDKAYWQADLSAEDLQKYYIEGNDVVLASSMVEQPSGSLVFYIYLRPNQLVDDARAAITTSFVKRIYLGSFQVGDTLTVTKKGVARTLTAVAAGSGAGQDEFEFDLNNLALTATSLNAKLIYQLGFAASVVDGVDYLRYSQYDTSITSSGSAVDSMLGFECDNVPTTYLDLDTNIQTSLFADGLEVDFLQTKPGHRTHRFDVVIPMGGIVGNIIYFNAEDVPTNFTVGDYICLANECIIPQIPPDLHNGLAERTCARILSALGDQAGMQATMVKVQEIEARQGTLLDNRVEGSPLKITGRRGLLRYGKK